MVSNNHQWEAFSNYVDALVEQQHKILEQADNDIMYDPQYRDTAHLYFDDSVPDNTATGIEFGGEGGLPINGLTLVDSDA